MGVMAQYKENKARIWQLLSLISYLCELQNIQL